jgi:hypothetical protein
MPSRKHVEISEQTEIERLIWRPHRQTRGRFLASSRLRTPGQKQPYGEAVEAAVQRGRPLNMRRPGLPVAKVYLIIEANYRRTV